MAETELTHAGPRRVLVVGAGGFLGSFLVSEGLKRGLEVWAGVRESTSRRYLSEPGLKFVTFDFDRPETLEDTLRGALPEEKWDYVIYNLGATKARTYSDFTKINYDYLRRFTEALKRAGKVPEKFLFISSLSVMGPGDEKGYAPFTEDMNPVPNTRYGASKLKAEVWMQSCGIPYLIFRCTGIYGPRDRDYYLEFKSVGKGVDFGVGYRRQMLTFVYGGDVAQAAYMALDKAPVGNVYDISEPRAYTQKEFRRMIASALGRKVVVPVRLPLWTVRMVSAVAEKIGVARNKPSTLNRDKYHIMKQRNWNVSVDKATRDFGFTAPTSLEQGVRQTVAWYKEEGWL